MLHTFIGYDPRQPIAYTIAHHSLITRCSKPVTVSPLILDTLPIEKAGLTPFTFTRWLVPWLMGYQGWALFMDVDVLVLGDVAELFELRDDKYVLQVSKNEQKFEWPSVMLWNCGHPANAALTPEHVESEDGKPFKFDWLRRDEASDPLGETPEAFIGDLPPEWNHLVGYDEPRNDAKLVHFTCGIPPFEETKHSEYADAWAQEHQKASSSLPWAALMGPSVHAVHMPDGRALPRHHPDVVAMQGAV